MSNLFETLFVSKCSFVVVMIVDLCLVISCLLPVFVSGGFAF